MAVTVEAEGTAGAAGRRGSARAVAVVSSAHFTSHFYLLLLPPLFPLLRDVYGVGYTELGFALSVFSIVTGCTQVPVGFAVDRFGARRILAAGLLLEGIAFVLIGLAPLYGALVALMALAGLANAVYHPADYSLLNASVNPRRMGRAFSFHTAAGMLGNAVAPVTMVFLMTFMDWRAALTLCGGVGIAVGLMVIFNGRVLKERPGAGAGAGAAAAGAPGGRRDRHPAPHDRPDPPRDPVLLRDVGLRLRHPVVQRVGPPHPSRGAHRRGDDGAHRLPLRVAGRGPRGRLGRGTGSGAGTTRSRRPAS